MSDLESVDLSQESGSEASLDISPSQETQPPVPPPRPVSKTPAQRPRATATQLTNTGSQNGTIAPERSKQPQPNMPASKLPVTASRSTTQAQSTIPEKTHEKAVEKPAEPRTEPVKPAPVKAKRGRPRKLKQQQRSEETATPEPQPSSKPSSATKPATTTRPAATTKPTTAQKPTATAKSATTPKSTLPSKQPPAPKAGAKLTDLEPPRTAGRGRKRRLATKPVEPTQPEGTQEKLPVVGVSTSPQPRVPEPPGPQKPAKPAERKLYGAARAAVDKRRKLGEQEEARGTTVPTSKPSRTKKKDSAGSTPEVSEIPASPPPKGRPTKRARRQSQKEVAQTVPQEVIRIEDDEALPEPAAQVTSVKDPFAKPAQVRGGTSQENATTSVATSRPAPAGNSAPSRGRQSLPPSFARPAARRSKTRETASAAPGKRQQDGPPQDLPAMEDAGSSPDQGQDVRVQTQNEFAKPTSNARPRRAHGVRHSTGNIGAMDTDDIPEPDTREHITGVSNDEAVKSMLDEIQRNAIPFLLTQDRICDSFSAQIGEDVDVILKDSDNDVFQVFSDRVKDALVADRLRLAIASAKTDLRRGIEKLLREFARKVGAPLAEADSSLLLRNELRSHSRVKDDKKASKPFASPSPRVLKQVVQHRMAEESNHHEDASDGDDISDDGDPILVTPRRLSTKMDIPRLSNAAEMRKFVGYSYDNLNLRCYRSTGILKLCAQPGGMTLERLHELTPLGRSMIKNKTKALIDRGYLVEDTIRNGDKQVTVFSTAPHIADT